MVPNTTELYLRLLGYIRPYWKAFALAICGMVGIAATEPVFPAIMKYLLDHGFKTEDTRLIWAIPLGIVLLFVVRAVLSFCTNYLMTWISTNVVTSLRLEMFAKALLLPTAAFHEQSSSRVIARILNDADGVNQASTNVLVIAVRETCTAVALIVYLIYLDWRLTLITLAVGPIISWIVKAFSQRVRAISRTNLNAIKKIAHTVEETVNAHKMIKIYGAQEQLANRFRRDVEGFRRSMMKEAIPASAITPVTHLAASLAVAIITYMAISKTTGQAGASAGGFASFITAMLLLIAPIKQLTSISPLIQRGMAAAESVFGFIDAEVEIDTGSYRLEHARGTVEFDEVSFQYPGAERNALTEVSLTIEAGQTVALVGASGGGKTTVSTLIPGFYRPSSGTIRIDGIDTADITLASLRHNIALVSQDIVLFNDTVEANIAFGSHLPSDREAVIAAAKAANAWDFIQQLPQGLDTLIGEDGAKLSGGQRQRIAIARALLKNAPILILDEATSALDTESERQVQAALATLMQNRTTLVIAHRLSTIEHADRILVLDQGRIVESGSHQELLQLGGYYANLNRLQT